MAEVKIRKGDWVVVADGAKALLLENDATAGARHDAPELFAGLASRGARRSREGLRAHPLPEIGKHFAWPG